MKSRAQGGFVLVATIWVLAAMVLFMGYVAYWSAQIQDSALRQAESVRWSFEQQSTLSTLVYLGATRRMSYAGLTLGEVTSLTMEDEFNPFSADPFVTMGGELRLDGTTYQGLGGTRFSVQDTGPLVGLKVVNSSKRLESLLRHYEISGREVRRLIAAMIDYTDRDDTRTLDGYESRGYEANGELKPTNRFLVSPSQVSNVMGWDAALGDRLPDFLAQVTIHAGNKNNFNTLTPVGMQTLGYLENSSIERILDHRRDAVFKSLAEVNRVAEVVAPADSLLFTSIPDPFLRVRIWRPSSRQEEWIGIRFTPLSGFAPWEIDYLINRQRQPESTNEALKPADETLAANIPQSVLFRPAL